MQDSSQEMPSGMAMGSEGSKGSSGATVVQNNINIINQPIIVIATNAGGSAPTMTMNAAIQPPAATHTVRSRPGLYIVLCSY